MVEGGGRGRHWESDVAAESEPYQGWVADGVLSVGINSPRSA